MIVTGEQRWVSQQDRGRRVHAHLGMFSISPRHPPKHCEAYSDETVRLERLDILQSALGVKL